MARGGKREGAGRKKLETTKRMSIPLSLVDEVSELIAEQKSLVLKPPSEINSLIEKMPEIQNDKTSMVYIGLLFDNWRALKRIPRNQKRMIIKLLK